jgi:hypothetical protein
MNIAALFGLSVLMSFGAFGIVAKIYLLPPLKVMRREDALIALVIPHTFRFIGLSFLIPGVVATSLSPAFAAPAAYGDLIATILAIVATLALYNQRSWAIPVVWVFNAWGALDLLFAFYQGTIGVRINPGSLGAAYFIPTVAVPAALVTHGLIFWLLLRGRREQPVTAKRLASSVRNPR